GDARSRGGRGLRREYHRRAVEGVLRSAAAGVDPTVAADGRGAGRGGGADHRGGQRRRGGPAGRRGDGVRAVRGVRESGGSGVKVSDAEIVAAIGRLARATGVFAEPGAAAALAGLLKLCEAGAIAAHERVVIVLTGNGLKDVETARRAAPEPLRVESPRVRPIAQTLAR